MRAFMPASRSGARDVPEMQTLVGQEIACRIIKLDTEKEDIVVDRRVVLEEERAKAKEDKLSRACRPAWSCTASCAACSITALLSISAASTACSTWPTFRTAASTNPSDALTVGQELDVKILKVDPGKKRISLGLKQLQADPWTDRRR